MIEGRLATFGFDVVGKYERWSWDALEDMVDAGAVYGDDLPFGLRTQRMLLVLKHRFWWKSIAGDEQDPCFWQKVQSAFPDLATDASGLEVAIEEIGFVDPDSIAAALSHLRHALDLDQIVCEPHSQP